MSEQPITPDRLISPEIQQKNEQITVFVDGTDPDNIALAVAARRMFGDIIVCLSPRPVSRFKDGSLEAKDLDAEDKQLSDEMHKFNARRMKKHLIDAGFDDVPVYLGIDIYHADNLKATIPHAKHIDERDYDFLGSENIEIDGDFDAFKQRISAYNGARVALMGGQFTDIDALMKDNLDFNLLITQGGFSAEDAARSHFSTGDQLPFNQELDRPAALDVFNNFQGDIIAISSTQTRREDVSYDDQHQMEEDGWLGSLVELYGRHREETTVKPNRTRRDGSGKLLQSSPHDVHLSLLKAFWDNKDQIEARHERSEHGGEPLYNLEKKRDKVEGGHGEYWVVTDLQGPRVKRLFGRALGDPQSHGR